MRGVGWVARMFKLKANLTKARMKNFILIPKKERKTLFWNGTFGTFWKIFQPHQPTYLQTLKYLSFCVTHLTFWKGTFFCVWAENSLKSCSEVAAAGTGAVTQFPSTMSPDGCKTSLSHSSGMSPWSGEEFWTMASLFCNCRSGAQQWTESVGMAKLEHKKISPNWAFSLQLDHLPENYELS